MTISQKFTPPPQRTEAHWVDTRAVRVVISNLPDYCIVRSMEERDYGIDLQLEIFDSKRSKSLPTGNFAFIQVKGQKASFSTEPKLKKFPVKTIKYAMMFDIPFFVVLTSLADNECRFVWLQKYADTALRASKKPWETQTTISINLPQKNTINLSNKKPSLGKERFLEIINEQTRRRAMSELLKIEHDLMSFMDAVVIQTLGVTIIDYFIDLAYRLQSIKESVFQKNKKINSQVEWLINFFEKQRVIRLKTNEFNISSVDVELYNKLLLNLHLVKSNFLQQDAEDRFNVNSLLRSGKRSQLNEEAPY